MSDFPKGIFAKEPHSQAPDFVKGKVSIKVADAIEWLKQQTDEWVNLDMKEAKTGKWYLAVNDYKPNQADHIEERTLQPSPSANHTNDEYDDLPF